MAANQVILQNLSWYGYDLPLKSGEVLVLPPKKNAPKNILIVSEEQYAEVKEIPTVKSLLEAGQLRELPKVPGSYYAPNEQIAAAKAEAQDARAEAAQKDTFIAQLQAQIDDLQSKLADLGGEVKKVKKTAE